MEWEGNNKVSFLYHGSYSEYMLKGMPEFNLGYGDILVLQNYGLLLANIDAIFFLSDPILESKVEIGGALLSLKSKNGTPIKVQIANVSPLSIAGHELRSIISLEVPPAHLQKQIEFLNVLGFEVISP
jgi:hypothetical protein